MPTTDDATPPESRTIVVTPCGGGWRERAIEAEAENALLHEQLAALSRREVALWFGGLECAAGDQDRKRQRGHRTKVPMSLIAKLEAEGWRGDALAARVREITKADERAAYRALARWREFKKPGGLVFVVEMDEHGRLAVTTFS
jgi:hypothetical protein